MIGSGNKLRYCLKGLIESLCQFLICFDLYNMFKVDFSFFFLLLILYWSIVD